MKKSADQGYASAQLDYGIILLANNSDDNKRIAEGISYLEKAADQNDKQALLKYVEVAQKIVGLKGEKKIIDKASSYCDVLISQSSDSFDTQQYEKSKEFLQKIKKDIIKRDRKNIRVLCYCAVGLLLSVLGALYMLIGIHPELKEDFSFLEKFPNAADFVILPIHKLWDIFSDTMNQNGYFGVELLTLAVMFKSAVGFENRKKIANVILFLSKVIFVCICVWHFAARVIEGNKLFMNFWDYAIIIFGSFIVGKILGFVLGKLTRTK